MKTEQNTVENQIETSQKPAETINLKKFNLLKFFLLPSLSPADYVKTPQNF